MEASTGCKISIRGKGSVKEGRATGAPGEDEDLHCYITADSEAKLNSGVELVNNIVEEVYPY